MTDEAMTLAARIQDVILAYDAGEGNRCEHVKIATAPEIHTHLLSGPQVPLVFWCGRDPCVNWMWDLLDAAGMRTMPAACDLCGREELDGGYDYTRIRAPRDGGTSFIVRYSLCLDCAQRNG